MECYQILLLSMVLLARPCLFRSHSPREGNRIVKLSQAAVVNIAWVHWISSYLRYVPNHWTSSDLDILEQRNGNICWFVPTIVWSVWILVYRGRLYWFRGHLNKHSSRLKKPRLIKESLFVHSLKAVNYRYKYLCFFICDLKFCGRRNRGNARRTTQGGRCAQ